MGKTVAKARESDWLSYRKTNLWKLAHCVLSQWICSEASRGSKESAVKCRETLHNLVSHLSSLWVCTVVEQHVLCGGPGLSPTSPLRPLLVLLSTLAILSSPHCIHSPMKSFLSAALPSLLSLFSNPTTFTLLQFNIWLKIQNVLLPIISTVLILTLQRNYKLSKG